MKGIHPLTVCFTSSVCRFGEIHADLCKSHTNPHKNSLPCASAFTRKNSGGFIPFVSERHTWKEGSAHKHAEVGTWGTLRAVCALVRGGLGRLGEAHADGLNTAVQSEMCGWSKINVETPGSEGLHPISASTRQPRTRLALLENHTGGHRRHKGNPGSLFLV